MKSATNNLPIFERTCLLSLAHELGGMETVLMQFLSLLIAVRMQMSEPRKIRKLTGYSCIYACRTTWGENSGIWDAFLYVLHIPTTYY